MTKSVEAQILSLNQRLLDSIAAADWETYETLCAPELTAFEPEARGQRVGGLDFHRFYFDAGPSQDRRHTTMVEPQVTELGPEAALLTYLRLVQVQTPQGFITQRSEETRVWQKRDGRWLHIHFHRSDNG